VIVCSAIRPSGASNRSQVADGLEHLDRDDRVVRAGEIAIVAQAHVDELLEARLADPGGGELVLCGRDRDRRHPTTAGRRGVHRHATPARTDLEQVIARPDRADLGHPLVLAALGRG